MTLARASVVLLLLAQACGVRGLNFVRDDRITIVHPSDRAAVTLPVTVAWRVKGFEVAGRDGSRRPDAGYFGVFVDRAPQPPRATQESLAADDEFCKRIPGCPNAEYLAAQNVHSTTDTSFTIERLPDPDPEDDRRELHELTVVLQNGRGERIGESAVTVEFEVRRDR